MCVWEREERKEAREEWEKERERERKQWERERKRWAGGAVALKSHYC